jgi:hypothetical protein
MTLPIGHKAGALSTRAAPLYPLVVAEWPRNAREVIRVALDQYQGRHTVNVRVWWHDEDGVLKPGKSGITLSLKRLPAMADALGAALVRAIELGLVEEGGEQ